MRSRVIGQLAVCASRGALHINHNMQLYDKHCSASTYENYLTMDYSICQHEVTYHLNTGPAVENIYCAPSDIFYIPAYPAMLCVLTNVLEKIHMILIYDIHHMVLTFENYPTIMHYIMFQAVQLKS